MIRYTTPTIPFEIEADFSLAEIIVSFVQDCVQLDKVIDPDDFYDVVQDGVEDALISSIKTTKQNIEKK